MKKFIVEAEQKGNFLDSEVSVWRFSAGMTILVAIDMDVEQKLALDSYIAEAILYLLANEDIISRVESWIAVGDEETKRLLDNLGEEEEASKKYFSFCFCHSISLANP